MLDVQPSNAPQAPSKSTDNPILSRPVIAEWVFVRVFGFMAVFLIAISCIQSFIFSVGRVNGRSMEPAYVDDDLFFINKLIYLFSTPKRYDVVQLIDEKQKKVIIKRVIGLPGEVVLVKAGNVYVEDAARKRLLFNERSYLSPSIQTYVKDATTTREWVIPRGHYFVLGDNRPHSTDSRDYGPVSRTEIIGNVMK